MRVLVLNAGSSSLKASVVDEGRAVARATVEWGSDATREADRESGVRAALDEVFVAGAPVGSIDAVGHRVVHGGERFAEPALIDDDVVAAIEALGELAPLHNAIAAETIAAARRVLPALSHVAVFDTAFHATLPEEGRTYPVPLRWRDDWGIRRYGFHGLSVEWSVQRAAELLGRAAQTVRLVVAHLGNGCSVSAIDGGRSVDTSMGLTPLEGLMMGTRAGSIDPGILLHVLRGRHLRLRRLGEVLEHGSGLLGISGTSADMRRLLSDADEGDERAALALRLFVRRAAAGIAAAATTLPALDALVFTGGIGEHAAGIRAAVVGRLGVLGLSAIDAVPVERDAILSAPGTSPAVLRVEAREDLVAARHVERALAW
jgi:acetate kinase